MGDFDMTCREASRTIPNQSGAIFGPTAGVARDMQAEIKWRSAEPEPHSPSIDGRLATPYGGGDLNGSAATTILFHQAGTDASRWQMPRIFVSPGNWCGIV